MYTQKQLIKFGLYAERAHRLAFDIALSASELGRYGNGMAVIADETRNVGNKLYSLFDDDNANEAQIIDAVLQLNYLAVNGCLEMMRLHESQLTIKKRIAVILDEIRNAIADIKCTFGIKQDLPLVITRITEENTVISNSNIFESAIRFVVFSIGGMTFCENASNVMEVLFCDSEQAKENTFQIRGEKIPLLNYYKQLPLAQEDNKYRTILRVCTEYEKTPRCYGVLIDSLPEIFFSSIGVSTDPVGIPSNLVRECWNCEENKQMIFLNYGNLK